MPGNTGSSATEATSGVEELKQSAVALPLQSQATFDSKASIVAIFTLITCR